MKFSDLFSFSFVFHFNLAPKRKCIRSLKLPHFLCRTLMNLKLVLLKNIGSYAYPKKTGFCWITLDVRLWNDTQKLEKNKKQIKDIRDPVIYFSICAVKNYQVFYSTFPPKVSLYRYSKLNKSYFADFGESQVK